MDQRGGMGLPTGFLSISLPIMAGILEETLGILSTTAIKFLDRSTMSSILRWKEEATDLVQEGVGITFQNEAFTTSANPLVTSFPGDEEATGMKASSFPMEMVT